MWSRYDVQKKSQHESHSDLETYCEPKMDYTPNSFVQPVLTRKHKIRRSGW